MIRIILLILFCSISLRVEALTLSFTKNQLDPQFVKFYHQKLYSFLKNRIPELKQIDKNTDLLIKRALSNINQFIVDDGRPWETFLIGFGVDALGKETLWLQLYLPDEEKIIFRKLDSPLSCYYKLHTKGDFICHGEQTLKCRENNEPIKNFKFNDSLIWSKYYESSFLNGYYAYFSGSVTEGLPLHLKQIVSLLGLEARLPFDKVMQLDSNEIVIFYP